MPETHDVACPVCGHAETLDGAGPTLLADVGLFRCDACDVRVVHGTVMPRIVIEPFRDARGFVWVRQRTQDPKTKADLHVQDFDPQLAALIAKSLLALVLP